MRFAPRAPWLATVLALVVACHEDAPADAAGGQGGGGFGGSAAIGGSAGGGAGGVAGTSAPAAGVGGSTGGAGGMTAGTGGAPAMLDASVDAQVPVDAGVDASDGEPEPQDLPQALRDLGVIALYPAPGSIDQCPDPALRIVLAAPPSLGSSGKVEIVDVASSAVVATLDMTASSITTTIDGIAFASERAAYVEGNEAVLYPKRAPLERGHDYAVRVASGVLETSTGSPLVVSDATWTFSTKSAVPTSSTSVTVSSTGDGDFCQPQNAIDFASDDGATIEIGRGAYHGIVHFKDKRGLTIRGADRKATILAGTNNENMNGGTAKRALIGVDDCEGFTIESLTIVNRTLQGGSQAEALRMQDCDRCIVRDADIISLQDTLLWSGRVYAENCYIAGNVDFIWGTGTAFFDHCEIKTLGRKGYTVQARNGAGNYGYVFVDSRMTSDPGITGHWLGRIDASVYPSSHVAYIDCELGPHIDPVGWQVTGFGGGSLRFWEHGSKNSSGAPIDIGQRHSSSRQLTDPEAVQMRDPSVVLGGWDPR